MSNQLKTLSQTQLETLISKNLGEYLGENIECTVSNIDTPNIDDEDKVEHSNKRTMNFEVTLSYRETDHV